jgi:hypothetical protein
MQRIRVRKCVEHLEFVRHRTAASSSGDFSIKQLTQQRRFHAETR